MILSYWFIYWWITWILLITSDAIISRLQYTSRTIRCCLNGTISWNDVAARSFKKNTHNKHRQVCMFLNLFINIRSHSTIHWNLIILHYLTIMSEFHISWDREVYILSAITPWFRLGVKDRILGYKYMTKYQCDFPATVGLVSGIIQIQTAIFGLLRLMSRIQITPGRSNGTVLKANLTTIIRKTPFLVVRSPNTHLHFN